MENTQFSFLTAIFGRKFPGDALAAAKGNLPGEPAAKDAEGFFTFVDGLLKPAAGTEAESDNLLVGELVGGQPQLPGSIEMKTLRERLDGKFVAEGGFSTEGKLAAPGIAKNQFSPSVNLIGSRQGAPAPDAPQSEAAAVTPTANTLLTEPGKEAAALAKSAAPLNSAVAQATVAQTTVEQGVIAAPQLAKKSGAALDISLPEQPEGRAVFELDLEGRARDGVSRFDAPVLKTQFEGPNAVLPPQANAALAIAEHAAPEALIHSAMTREDVAALNADRFAASRLEIVSHATDRNAHLNPIRDQLAAAVAARHGENKLEIRLDPPELGKILIGFDRDGTDIVRAVISADSPETLDLMRRHADVFQRALEAQGFENIDLHFADKGPGENAEDMAEENFKNLRLADDAGPAGIMSSAPALIDGRLDRRL